MAAGRELSERKTAILHALVRHYIRTGEPVSSEAIGAASGLAVSTATIRNELAALEEMGYLSQPHTSAGRAPTDLAYRHYVDTLPSRTRLPEGERKAIVAFFGEALADVDEILRGTTSLLSRVTRYASLALAPSLRESAIARCELVQLGSSTLLLVVFDTGAVEKRLIEVPPAASERDVEEVSRLLTETFRTKSLSAARREALPRMQPRSEAQLAILKRVGEALRSIEDAVEAEHVFLSGAGNIAAEQAFHRRETLRQILDAVERQSEILALLREAAAAPPVTVTIGRENPVTGMWEASVVAAPYAAHGRSVGTIGVVGPTRMDYAAAISAVRAVANRLSEAVETLAG